jgi:ATP-dependent RNA helicase DeaD
MNFSDFNLKKEILRRLDEIGFEKPSPIQEKAIPLVLEGKDIVCLLYTSPSPRDRQKSRMPSSA